MPMDFRFGGPEHTLAQTTDDAWSAELQRRFGKRAGDVRYTLQGKGEPGSVLRLLYDARDAAREAYGAAITSLTHTHTHAGETK